MRIAFWYHTLVVPSLLAGCCHAGGGDTHKGAYLGGMPRSPMRQGLQPFRGSSPMAGSTSGDNKPQIKLAPIVRGGGVTSPSRKVATPPVKGSNVAIYDVGVSVLTVVALTASFALLDGVVERTMGATSVLCVGLALSAYGDSITSFLSGSAQATSSELDKPRQMEFASFQRNFLSVQLVATFVDFIQGPYLYKVYESYGYGMADIATLYLVGFASSALSSAFVGFFADKYGRRTGCMAYTILQTISIALLHVNQFWPLVLGRFISGVATSFLSTCYECWMVSEHNRRGFPGSLIGSTFSAYVFLMGLVAVASGTVAGFAERRNGVLAPFVLCGAAALVNLVMLPIMWRPDNYGDNKPSTPGKSSTALKDLYQTFFGGKAEVFWVGLTQVCFEVAMFTWIFMWTPALDTGEIKNLNLGNVFATFMIGVMIGSSSFKILTGNYWKMSTEAVLLGALAVGTASLGFSAYNTQASLLINAFVVYEAVVGVYFSAMGTIRAKFIPEGQRATIMNVMRLVLNVFVVVMLWGPIGSSLPMDQKKPLVLGLSSLFLLLSCFSHSRLVAAVSSSEADKAQ